MAAPTLSAAEIAQLEAEKQKQIDVATTFDANVANQDAAITELTSLDASFKKFFDYYNDDVIGKYDGERKLLDGKYISSPIVEADIEGPATIDPAHRTTPVNPVTDITRIDEFDGTPLAQLSSGYEQDDISTQAEVEDTLVNGYTSATPDANTQTDSSITSASTTVDFTNATSTFNISAGDTVVVNDGSDLAIFTLDTFTDTSGSPPPYTVTSDITFILAPSGTIAAGEVLAVFSGFSNSERTTKTASDSDYQPLMNSLINDLETAINNRITRLDAQDVLLNANEDPDATAEITTTLSNNSTSRSFLQNYLLTTDISDTGLGTLSTERGTRSSQITTRISQIVANYTGQTLNYYNERYTYANNRGNTSRGTLRLLKSKEGAKATSLAFKQAALDQVSAIDALLAT